MLAYRRFCDYVIQSTETCWNFLSNQLQSLYGIPVFIAPHKSVSLIKKFLLCNFSRTDKEKKIRSFNFRNCLLGHTTSGSDVLWPRIYNRYASICLSPGRCNTICFCLFHFYGTHLPIQSKIKAIVASKAPRSSFFPSNKPLLFQLHQKVQQKSQKSNKNNGTVHLIKGCVRCLSCDQKLSDFSQHSDASCFSIIRLHLLSSPPSRVKMWENKIVFTCLCALLAWLTDIEFAICVLYESILIDWRLIY